MVQRNQLQGNQTQKALRRGAKAVLMSRGVNPSTRRGNKELDMLLNKLAQKSYASLEDAVRMGEAVGWEIAKLAERRNQTNLDASVIRQVAESGDLFALTMPQAGADHDQANAADSQVTVDIDMKRGGSPIEKTPEISVSGKASESSPAAEKAQEDIVKSEPVTPLSDEDDAATAADIESDAPMPGSLSEAMEVVTPPRSTDGADMDSEAEEEAAAVDADDMEDVMPDPEASEESTLGADDDVTVSVPAKNK
ncbi:succinate dehydrogenase assembly factor 2 [Pseudanabaena sp. FACHB-2040]|uniref:succinate dehydrogenase assembly factor 2 n=1 Tax=Pseudanabaena sp. FACHB-2040 TaxID=2692859 RepID=UPI0016861BCA|nr:succinate dehydrogenase assembly factor 2 [Pseudanabaena sp. FACHB-2040]MBD2259718.1 succinate dehydrogenase assembly factor 2 [Pseudanabaena sp. FACHB-2040]